MQDLRGKVAVVAGATRGVGRGIACMLGEAGATVYCTGRSVRGRPNTTGYFAGRPEHIDETAEMATARGGVGIAVQVDHLEERQVAALFERVAGEQRGRLDVLVNDISEGVAHDWKPFWEVSLEKGFRALRRAAHGRAAARPDRRGRRRRHVRLPRHTVLRPGEGGGLPARLRDGRGAPPARGGRA